jgi:tRNA-Thr(GGU) m(6)t(6)A37 methyltransferase TsaA
MYMASDCNTGLQIERTPQQMQEITQQESIGLIPIGRVINGIEYPSHVKWETITSEVVIAPHLVEALDGIDDFSHIVIIFYLHEVNEGRRSRLKVHPQGRQELPLVGVFATRSPVRPNPIGVTVVKLLERQENVLQVLGLDAYDGTPVLDVKPYLRQGDFIEEATTPDWLLYLWELQDSGR